MINPGTILGREAEEDLADELRHQIWRRSHGAAVCEDLVGIEECSASFAKTPLIAIQDEFVLGEVLNPLKPVGSSCVVSRPIKN